MHLPTHLLLSWLVGHSLEHRRDRVIVAWAGVAPDLDALTILGGLETYGEWHHVLTHGLFAALAVALVSARLATRRLPVALLSLATFHLHLVCDLLGSGREWTIMYLYPASRFELMNPHGWPLASWQNISLTALGFVVCAVIGVRRGRTFAETWLPATADSVIVATLRARFGGTTAREPPPPQAR